MYRHISFILHIFVILGSLRSPADCYFADHKHYAESHRTFFIWKMDPLQIWVPLYHIIYLHLNYIICFCSLVYYIHPTDSELKKLAGIPQPKPKQKPKEGENKRGKHKRKWVEEPVEDKTFTVPRNLDLQVYLPIFKNMLPCLSNM